MGKTDVNITNPLKVNDMKILFEQLEGNYGGDIPLFFDINHDVEYDSHEEKEVGYIHHCSRIGKVTAILGDERGEVQEIRILLDQ